MGTVDPVSLRVSPVDCTTWAREVMAFLSTKFTKDQRSVELNPIVKLATHMLSHLLIASMSLHLLVYFALGVHYGSQKSWREENPSGKYTPQSKYQSLTQNQRLIGRSSYQEESIGTEGTRV
jgi:hypothetical protein